MSTPGSLVDREARPTDVASINRSRAFRNLPVQGGLGGRDLGHALCEQNPIVCLRVEAAHGGWNGHAG